MDRLSAGNVASITKKVAAYGSQLAAVFHSYSLSAQKIPHGFTGAINVLDATVATLNQVLSLLTSEAEGIKAGSGKNLFSDEGLKYVELLASECATTLAKVEPIVGDACLDAKEFKAKRRRQKRALAKNGPLKIDITELKLDEKAFFDTVECAKWSLATAEIEECIKRLYDIQLCLLLVFCVVTVGVISTDLSSGKVDVKSIVAFHERINRTAELVGIKLPNGRSKNRCSNYDSSSDTDSLLSSSDSDSDNSSILSLRHSNRAQVKESGAIGPPPPPPVPFTGGPPPPPRPHPSNWPGGPPPSRPPWNRTSSTTPSPAVTLAGATVNSANPPSYSECKPATSANALSSATSTLLGTVSQKSDFATSISSEEQNKSQPTVYADEKEKTKETPNEKKEIVLTPLEPRIFKSNTKGLRFKFKSLFRSNQSLADEMKKALSDTDSHLLAVAIQGGSFRQIPHSAFHSLEATHMRTILSQLNDDTWYDTFTKMNAVEHSALERLLHPWMKGKMYERELVVLKVIHEKKFAWAALLREIVSKYPTPYTNSRVILAIVREKFLDGKPLPLHSKQNFNYTLSLSQPCLIDEPFAIPSPRFEKFVNNANFSGLPPPPPPPPQPPIPYLQPLNVVPAVRPPPAPAVLSSTPGRSTKTSDLRFPPPPRAVPLPVQLPTAQNPPVAGITAPGPPPPRPCPPPSIAAASIRVSDTTPLTDYDAMVALTTYNEYTLHLAESVNPGVPRSWSRVIVTQESAERHLILQRVQAFQRAGGNALEAKLRLNEPQGSQVTRLMDELKGNERDSRFEWCWVEISLYNNCGEITDFVANGNFKVGSATMMHLIAKRMPKVHCKPMELYNSLMRPQPPAPVMNTTPSTPVTVNLSRCHRDSQKSKYDTDSDSDSDSDSSDESSLWSDNSSVGNVRRRLRKNKVRRAVRATWASDSDEDDSEDEDPIKIKLELKRGDDVVQSLLDMWTPQIEVKGSGKEKEKARKADFGVVEYCDF